MVEMHTSWRRRLPPLLEAGDPPACESLVGEAGGGVPLLLVCDHASNHVPERFGRLGVSPADLAGHIAWDIGAAAVTRALSRRLGAPAVLSGYSRLLMDLNRAPDDPSAFPEVSGGVAIPGNRGLDDAERERRHEALFRPYHDAIAAAVTGLRCGGRQPVLVSIHSFTPCLCGDPRPWHVGVLWNRDSRLAAPAIERLCARGDLCVGRNQPYSAREVGFTLDAHAHAAGLAHVTFEIRQDLVADERGRARWADLLGELVTGLLADSCGDRSGTVG
ncbi:MAG: N-formylglutamate amidohydrolase [Alphaproteobacteria bacterium]